MLEKILASTWNLGFYWSKAQLIKVKKKWDNFKGKKGTSGMQVRQKSWGWYANRWNENGRIGWFKMLL